MKNILKYLKDYKKETVLGPLFKLLEASFELIVPLVMVQIIDVGIKNKDTTYVLQMIGIMVLLGLVGLVCSITAQYYAAKAATVFGTSLRKNLFKHIQGLSYTEMDTLGSTTLITRMTSDINQVQTMVNLFLRIFLRSPFVVVGAMIMAFYVNIKAALVFVVAIPLLAIVVFGVMLISIPLYDKVQSGIDKVLVSIRENLTGVRVIRAFHKEEEEKEEFEKKNSRLVNAQLRVGKVSAVLNPVTYTMINLAIIAVIWIGAKEVDDGVISQGQVVALINYMSQILVEMIKLANLIISMNKGLACANRISKVFDVKSSLVDPKIQVSDNDAAKLINQTKEKQIVFDNVSFRYKDASADSLTNISFNVDKGETIGIIGGTGAGKSTLINLIPRFYDVSQGNIIVDGRNVNEYPLETLRGKVGIVPQKAVLFKGTIRENLKWGKKDASQEEMEIALISSQAMDFIEEKKNGLDYMVVQGGKNLSGGQRQRLAIARALIKRPEILILDDSSSALDYATDARLRKAIGGLDEDMTTFIVSQRAASILHADKIIVLNDGKIVAYGPHKELINECEIYQEIYYSQFPKEAANEG